MKKNILNITITFLLIFTTLLFTSCFDPIYHTISTDVRPEKPTVSGPAINSIARYNVGGKEYIVLAANGGLRYKLAENTTHGSWNVYKNLPFVFAQNKPNQSMIFKVFADTNYLYIFTYKLDSNKYEIHTAKMNSEWNLPADQWKLVPIENLNLANDAKSSFYAFATNDYNSENRKVYIRSTKENNSTYYVLNGAENPIKVDLQAQDHSDKPVNSAVFFQGKEYFFNSKTVVANDKFIYYGDDKDIYYGTKAPFNKQLSVGAPISALTLCSDSLLIGCGDTTIGKSGGLKKTTLTDGIPGKETVGFDTNAAFQITSSHMVLSLLNITPTNTEKESTLYATITFAGIPAGTNKDIDKGLWSYYPKRGNWNRE